VSLPDPELGELFGDLEFTLADLLQVAILTGTHVLLKGDTGSGKTELARMVATAAFGDDWFLLRLNPNLDEQTFANLRLDRLQRMDDGVEGIRDCVEPADFLAGPMLALDEVNRTPAALTNILLGYLDGRIELKFGVKQNVGWAYSGPDGTEQRYSLVMATMNEGSSDFHGAFELDRALARRFTLAVNVDEFRPTAEDCGQAIAGRTGRAEVPHVESMVEELAPLADRVAHLPLDDLARIYLLYCTNMDRCVHSPTGYKNPRACPEICARAECRIHKIATGFCASTSGLSLAVAIYLKRAAAGLTALRAARVLTRAETVLRAGGAEREPAIVSGLEDYAHCKAKRAQFLARLAGKYLGRLAVCVEDVRALLPFAAAGGKVHIADEYLAKHFAGSRWQGLRHYATESYSWLLSFLRDNSDLLQSLAEGNGAVEKLRERLRHAEKFTDPFIRHVVEPFLDRHERRRSRAEVAGQLADNAAALDAADRLVNV
jgi:hypothetical protein